MGDPQVASQRAHWSKPTTSKNRSKYQQTMNLGDLYAQVPATEESRRSGTSYGWAECPCRPVCIHLHSLQPWSERGEEQDGAFCTIHVCVSAGAGKALLSVDLCGQPCVCVVCVLVCLGSTYSTLLLPEPRGMELQCPHICWATGLSYLWQTSPKRLFYHCRKKSWRRWSQ